MDRWVIDFWIARGGYGLVPYRIPWMFDARTGVVKTSFEGYILTLAVF